MSKREPRDHFAIRTANFGVKPPPTQPRPPAPPSQKLKKHSSFDIFELLTLVNQGDIKFFEENGYIYVENTKGEALILNKGEEKRD